MSARLPHTVYRLKVTRTWHEMDVYGLWNVTTQSWIYFHLFFQYLDHVSIYNNSKIHLLSSVVGRDWPALLWLTRTHEKTGLLLLLYFLPEMATASGTRNLYISWCQIERSRLLRYSGAWNKSASRSGILKAHPLSYVTLPLCHPLTITAAQTASLLKPHFPQTNSAALTSAARPILE